MRFPVTTPSYIVFLIGITLVLSVSAHAAHHRGMGSLTGKALGVGVSELSSEALEAVNLEHGVRVERVVLDSPAKAAGLEQGDVIVELLGKPVYSVERLRWLVRQAPESKPVNLRLQRDGSSQTVTVEFRRPQATAKSHRVLPGGHGHSLAFLGVQIQPMTPQLRRAFGASEDAGVLVAAVVKDSPAEKAGLAVGDIIVRMDRKRIQRVADFYRVLRYFDPGESVEMEVIREKASETLTAQLGQAIRHMPPMHRQHGMSMPRSMMPLPGTYPMGWGHAASTKRMAAGADGT